MSPLDLGPKTSDLEKALLFVEGDPLSRRLSADQKEKWVEEALALGCEEAISCVQAHGTRRPFVLAKRMGVSVFLENGEPETLSYFRPDPPTIVLYPQAITIALSGFTATLGKVHPFDVALAHELFHAVLHLKARKTPWKVPRFPFFKETFQSSLRSLEELAAHSFAKELLRLPSLPLF